MKNQQKIFYITQNITMIRSLIDSSVIKELLSRKTDLEKFDLYSHYSFFKDMLENHHKNKLSAHEVSLNSLKYASDSLYSKIIDREPGIIFMINGDLIDQRVLRFAKIMGHKIVMWQVDDPYMIDITGRNARYADLIFTVDSSAIEEYKKQGCPNVHFLPLGCNREVFFKDKAAEKYNSDILFIGTPFKGSYRVKAIDHLADLLIKYDTKIIGSHVQGETWAGSLSNHGLLKSNISEEILPYQETAKYYNGAKIVLNIHRDSFGSEIDKNAGMIKAMSPNERTFNIAACGAFQLIDDKRPDTKLLLKEGEEIVSFANYEDLKNKITYYLDNDKERKRIAGNAYRAATERHTLGGRINEIMNMIDGKLSVIG